MANSMRRRGVSESLVDLVIGDAELASAVRRLPPHMLGALVRHVGIEDSGDLMALATADQLCALADDELWLADRGGSAEIFDADQFAIWVEVLVDTGPGVVGDALVSLDEDLLAHALAQHLMVLDLDRLAPIMSAAESSSFGDSDIAEKLLEASLTHELDELLLVSLRYRGWDAIIEAIHELESRDYPLVRRILDRICNASMERVADDGLHSVLSESETLAADARGARDDRRERRGFVAPADARAFLAVARERPHDAGDDPITKSYFRNYAPTPASRPTAVPSRLIAVLREQGVAPAAPMLPATSGRPSAARVALGQLRDTDPNSHDERLTELVYVANLLAASRTMEGRPLSQGDALAAALTFVDAGMADDSSCLLQPRSLVRLFARGWSNAHRLASSDDPAIAAARALLQQLEGPAA